MGGTESKNSYSECVAFQQTNPTKECCYPGGIMCDSICLPGLGSVPECQVSGVEKKNQVEMSKSQRKGTNWNFIWWVVMGLLVVTLASRS